MPRGIHDVTVSVPGYGNRRVTIIYPATSDGTDTTMTGGLHPMLLVAHGQIGNGSFSSNGEGIGFAGSSYLHRSMTDIGYVVVAPHFTDVVNQMQEGTDVAKFFITYATSTWAQSAGVDEDAIGFAGTSMGGMIGYALMNTNFHDSRIKAYYVRATSRLGSTSGSLVAGPALCHAHGTSDTTVSFSSGQSAYNAHGQPRAFITLPGVQHSLIVTGPYYENNSNPAASGLAGFFGYFLEGDTNGLTVLQTAVTNVTSPNDASMATDWGTLGGTPPNVTGFSPSSGVEGATIQVNGTNFTGATSVTFGGVSASFSVISSTRIDAVVPVGAVDGVIAVTTSAGSDASPSSFDVTAAPPPTTTTGFSGTWCIREVGTNQHTPASSLSAYNSARPQVLGAMNVDCFVGFGLRIGWDHIETGRLKLTASAGVNSSTLTVQGTHPALMNGQVLSFASTPTTTPVEVTVSGAHAANVTTINVVASHGAIANGARAGIYDDRVLDAAYNDIDSLGYKFAPRIMNGKYSPSNLVTDGSPTHTDGNGTYHEPYNSSGVTNPIVLLALAQLYRHIFEWADDKNADSANSVPVIMAGTLPGMDYAELYFSGSGAGGDYVAQLHGQSSTTNKNRMVSANSDLMDALVTISAGRYPVGFGISGLGDLSTILAPGIAAHAASYGDFNTVAYVNANGWAPNGEWGTTAANETTFDNNVWSVDVNRGVQDISPSSARTAANWTAMFQNHCLGLPNADADWCEIYAYQVRNASGTGIGIANMNANQAAWDEMVAQANAFNALFAGGAQTVTLPLNSQAATTIAPTFESDFTLVQAPAINQSAVTYAPTFTRKVTVGLIDNSATTIAPQFGVAQTVEPDLLDQSAVTFAPQVAHTAVMPGLLQNNPTLYNPTFNRSFTMAFMDQSAVTYAPTFVQGSGLDMAFIDQSATAFGPRFNMQAVMDLVSQAATAIAPQVNRSFSVGLISQDPTTFAPQVNQSLALSLVDQSAATIAPAVTTDASFEVFLGTIDQSAVPVPPVFIQGTPDIALLGARYAPTIQLEARYDSDAVALHGRYTRTVTLRARAAEET